MRDDVMIDCVQTAGIIVIALILAYVVMRLERALNTGAEKLKTTLANQREMLDSLNKVWNRINDIENRQGIRKDFIPTDELRTTLALLSQRLEQLEADHADRTSVDH